MFNLNFQTKSFKAYQLSQDLFVALKQVPFVFVLERCGCELDENTAEQFGGELVQMKELDLE